MRIKTNIPYLVTPLGVIMFSCLIIDILQGKFDSSIDLPRYIIWSIYSLYSIAFGLTQWNKPYIITNDKGIMVFGKWYSQKPSQTLPWKNIKKHLGRTLCNIKILTIDDNNIKIPISGISEASLSSLLSLIEEKTIKS